MASSFSALPRDKGYTDCSPDPDCTLREGMGRVREREKGKIDKKKDGQVVSTRATQD